MAHTGNSNDTPYMLKTLLRLNYINQSTKHVAFCGFLYMNLKIVKVVVLPPLYSSFSFKTSSIRYQTNVKIQLKY